MANIAFEDLEANKRYGNYTLGKDWFDTNSDGKAAQDELIENPLGMNTTMYKMMQYAKSRRVTSITASEPVHFELVYWSQQDRSSVITISGVNALVTIWKVRR
jgi:hypothetical protein